MAHAEALQTLEPGAGATAAIVDFVRRLNYAALGDEVIHYARRHLLDTVGVMIPMDPDESERARWDVDFWIDGVDAGAERAAAAGGTRIAPAFDVGGFRSAVLADPAGAVFSISELMIEP